MGPEFWLGWVVAAASLALNLWQHVQMRRLRARNDRPVLTLKQRPKPDEADWTALRLMIRNRSDQPVRVTRVEVLAPASAVLVHSAQLSTGTPSGQLITGTPSSSGYGRSLSVDWRLEAVSLIRPGGSGWSTSVLLHAHGLPERTAISIRLTLCMIDDNVTRTADTKAMITDRLTPT